MATFAVVLNYRTSDATARAVSSLVASGFPAHRVVVVDNASGDGSAGRLRAALPEATLIEASANGGFSAGCNLGIRAALEAGAKHVLLLNSDAWVTAGMVNTLEDALASSPALGIVGPLVVSAGAPSRVESRGIAYHPGTGRMRHLGAGRFLSDEGQVRTREVAGVSGCAMLVRRELLERIGLLDEAYFFGFEDLDLCLRAWDAAFSVACVDSARVIHESNLTIGRQSPRRIYFATRNHLRLVSRRASGRSAVVRAWLTLSVCGLNLAHVLFTSDVRPLSPALRAFGRGVRDHRHGRYGADAC